MSDFTNQADIACSSENVLGRVGGARRRICHAFVVRRLPIGVTFRKLSSPLRKAYHRMERGVTRASDPEPMKAKRPRKERAFS